MARLFDDFELDRKLSLALHDRCTFFLMTRHEDISHLNPHQITASQLAVDKNVEKRKVLDVLRDLKTHADLPDMLGLQRAFLIHAKALVPSWDFGATEGKMNCAHGSSSVCQAHPSTRIVPMAHTKMDQSE
jgi:hypothetical protein